MTTSALVRSPDDRAHVAGLVTAGINWTLWRCRNCGAALRVEAETNRLGWDGRAITLTNPSGAVFPVWPGLPTLIEARKT